jgi:HD domain
MEIIYTRIRQRARQIVSRYPSPDFYQDHSLANELSIKYFETNASTEKLRSYVAEHLEDNFGHGIKHAIKVAIDAGALMIIESKLAGRSDSFISQRVMIVQCAGLLHDIQRKRDDHAIKGADYARQVLQAYPFKSHEVDDICRAIRNHEAFKKTVESNTTEGALVSFFNISVTQFMDFYPEGMEKLAKIKPTFRTNTGKKYGPQFIDLGLAIGEELFDVIRTEFAHLL